MNLKLDLVWYTLFRMLIWISYMTYLIFIFLELHNLEIIVSSTLVGIVIYLSIHHFLKSWYYNKQPYLLDWFRLSTFIYLVFDFLNSSYNLSLNEGIEVYQAWKVKIEFVLPSIFVIIVGLCALNFAEIILLKKNKKIRSIHKPITYSIKSYFAFYSIAFIIGIVQILLLVSNTIGYGTYVEHTTASYSFLIQIVNILSPLLLLSFSIFKFVYNESSKTFYLFFILYFLIQLTSGLLSGMKEEVITTVFLVGIPYLLGGRKIPKIAIGLIAAIILILYPLNNSYRYILNTSPELSKDVAFKLAFESTLSEGLLDNIQKGTDNFKNRMSLFSMLMYSVENEQKWTEFKYLNRFIYLPVAWIIPRFIIPEKPTSDFGGKLYDQIVGRDTSSITPSTYGWAYLEGGFLFVFISFFVFGLIITIIQNRVDINSFFGLLVYSIILVKMLKVETDVYFLISGIFQSVLIIFVFYKLFIRKYTSNASDF